MSDKLSLFEGNNFDIHCDSVAYYMRDSTLKEITYQSVALLQHTYQLVRRRPQRQSLSDAQFCQGGLVAIYPEIEVSDCTVIPPGLREKISKEWGPPKVKMANAKKRKYVLMMVDPDAPSHSNPVRSHWRHWLIADIKLSNTEAQLRDMWNEDGFIQLQTPGSLKPEGNGLRSGIIKDSVLSEYARPTPPQRSGLHRYQFMLFEQPGDQTLSLNKKEMASLGNWEPQAFIARFRLGCPVQFLTQNYKD